MKESAREKGVGLWKPRESRNRARDSVRESAFNKKMRNREKKCGMESRETRVIVVVVVVAVIVVGMRNGIAKLMNAKKQRKKAKKSKKRFL